MSYCSTRFVDANAESLEFILEGVGFAFDRELDCLRTYERLTSEEKE